MEKYHQLTEYQRYQLAALRKEGGMAKRGAAFTIAGGRGSAA